MFVDNINNSFKRINNFFLRFCLSGLTCLATILILVVNGPLLVYGYDLGFAHEIFNSSNGFPDDSDIPNDLFLRNLVLDPGDIGINVVSGFSEDAEDILPLEFPDSGENSGPESDNVTKDSKNYVQDDYPFLYWHWDKWLRYFAAPIFTVLIPWLVALEIWYQIFRLFP